MELKQGQRVKFKIDNTISGFGKIVGKSMNDLPIIGGTYIIEPDESITSEVYPYSHFVLPEINLEIV